MSIEGVEQRQLDKWFIDPMKRFINNSTTSGIILFSSALVAMLLANSPWSQHFHHFWENEFSIGFNGSYITKSLHHWINDGLMAVFFFVVGLELKREIVAGELRDIRKAMLPIGAAIGGMLFPALIYFIVNPSGVASNGWGIPMATDIAFALGVLYLLGDKVPVSLKIFLTVLAIADDLGAVLVIAFFYTSEIDFVSLMSGGAFLIILIISNLIGIRSTLYYAIIGIGGLWFAFLISGVHATIAAVLAAFTIPANVKFSEVQFNTELNYLLAKFKEAIPNKMPTVTTEQLHILEEVRTVAKSALTPLQRLEHGLHPFVAFIILPIFALANAGITLSGDVLSNIFSPVSSGVFLGLILGKVIGVLVMVTIFIKLKWAVLPDEITKMHLVGVAFLAAIGFTMSLFITGLAFTDVELIMQAKLGILSASLLASFIGFFIIRKAGN